MQLRDASSELWKVPSARLNHQSFPHDRNMQFESGLIWKNSCFHNFPKDE